MLVMWTYGRNPVSLTELGCDPTLPGYDGDMPIHVACFGGQLSVVIIPYH